MRVPELPGTFALSRVTGRVNPRPQADMVSRPVRSSEEPTETVHQDDPGPTEAASVLGIEVG